MNNSADRLATHQRWLLAAFVLLPLLLMAGKLPGLPTSDFLMSNCSLLHLPARMQARVNHILFVPLGAVLVVFCRLTLGIRVLGPFRSILLAFAFQSTGIVPGLAFLAATVGIIVAIGPPVRALRLPYFGRISAMLSGVALIIVVGILCGSWLDLDPLRRVAYFPLVVLCLIGDAFVRTVAREGVRSALWRSSMTAVVAVILTYLSAVPRLKLLMLSCPELVCLQAVAVALISKFCAWRCLEWLNPKVGRDDDEDKDEEEYWIGPPVPGRPEGRVRGQPESDPAASGMEASLQLAHSHDEG
jgi:hypothetical protein